MISFFSMTAPTISNRSISWLIHFVSPQKEQKTPKWVHIIFAFFIINPYICCLALSHRHCHRHLAEVQRPAELSCFLPPPFRRKASSQFAQVFFCHHFKYDFDTIFAGGRKFTSSLQQDISEGRVEGQTHRFQLDTLERESIQNHTLASAAVGPSDIDKWIDKSIFTWLFIHLFMWLATFFRVGSGKRWTTLLLSQLFCDGGERRHARLTRFEAVKGLHKANAAGHVLPEVDRDSAMTAGHQHS